MSQKIIAIRYAKALFVLACKENKESIIEAELAKLIEVLDENKKIKGFLDNPVFRSEDKQKIIKELWNKSFSSLLFDFIELLIDKRRFYLIGSIYKEYNLLFMEKNKNIIAQVESAVPLSGDIIKKIESVLSKFLSMNVISKESLNPALLAGIRIKINDEIIDGSAAGRLKELKEQLKTI